MRDDEAGGKSKSLPHLFLIHAEAPASYSNNMNQSERTINEALGPRWAHVPALALDETDSTNTRLKAWAREGKITAPYLLTADSQTAGRGRLGRRFVSPPGTGL